ncbi:NAD(P)/FAD-dependent oxidoreductase [Marinospirillum alkaliphilum]|uniref:Amine oxidase domain-containing protein n=1 Tax=Marinospirillum alkaliphilum DSM 21637 TaxID=1122209 RepID=A0A1K1Y163_9GAMM|nr:FAD-dependent oxidoreductase [Marinospirillum alkaliphilum]SFX55738.1 hypothetical protein SAMN02745752_02069 [Marinospirillum alkaliphilum DSM 21637]
MHLSTPHHAIIGAGLAGLSCALKLQGQGHRVTLFEKARGPGGRLSSRRRLETTFDLGCQSLGAESETFQLQLEVWQKQGWLTSEDQLHFYPPGRMSHLTRQLAESLATPDALQCQTRIVQLQQHPDGWWLTDDQGQQHGPFDQVTLAIPATQALALLETCGSSLATALQQAQQQAVWVAYFVLPAGLHTRKTQSPAVPLRRCTLLNDKPGQAHHLQRWVIEADCQWSEAHQHLPAEQVARQLFELWAACQQTPEPLLLEAHRWLYGFTTQALKQPFLLDNQTGLALCGDFCLGDQAEHAWLSGNLLARALSRPVQ